MLVPAQRPSHALWCPSVIPGSLDLVVATKVATADESMREIASLSAPTILLCEPRSFITAPASSESRLDRISSCRDFYLLQSRHDLLTPQIAGARRARSEIEGIRLDRRFICARKKKDSA